MHLFLNAIFICLRYACICILSGHTVMHMNISHYDYGCYNSLHLLIFLIYLSHIFILYSTFFLLTFLFIVLVVPQFY